MTKIHWRTLIITGIICLSPVILGLSVYHLLPEQVAIHFDINNRPDNYVSRPLMVFGIPVLMLAIQAFSCIVSDLTAARGAPVSKLERVCKGIIPAMSVILYAVTIVYALGAQVDIRKIVCFILGVTFVLIGNYLPKLQSGDSRVVHPRIFAKNERVWRRTVRSMGYGFFLLGLMAIASIFLPPIVSVVSMALIPVTCIVLLICSACWMKRS